MCARAFHAGLIPHDGLETSAERPALPKPLILHPNALPSSAFLPCRHTESVLKRCIGASFSRRRVPSAEVKPRPMKRKGASGSRLATRATGARLYGTDPKKLYGPSV
jgi:hypothetical protein